MPLTFTDRANEALVSVWWTGVLLGKASRRLFRAVGGTEAQFNLMSVLRDDPGPLTQNDLSRRLLVDRSNVTGLLDRMESAGLIARNNVEGDRRSYHITLTSKGSQALERMDAAYREKLAQIMSELTAEQQRTLTELTAALRRGLVLSGLAGRSGRKR
jgi:DNA-binding MarR family transcriptional regulator